MRSKPSSRTRTRTHSREQHQQSRAWGTRFDYLNTSPPPAQQSSPIPSPTTSTAPDSPPKQFNHALSLKLCGANAESTEKLDWADDDVPSTLFSPGRTPLVLNLASGSAPARKEIAKQPHNASVFVGSLPPDTDEAEMAQRLAQHLAHFANVQTIKIVHDSKGGLCAFVQCENASQAAQLVSQAQASRQLFMGRHLRYENARARRTLWISYRTPIHFMPCVSKDEEGPDIVMDENGVKGRWIESDLPDALRIWKPREVRFPVVNFRGEARNIGDASRFDKDASFLDIPPAFRPKGVLFADIKFDAQTVRKMAEAFGPLESFETLTSGNNSEEPCAYPVDHDGSRATGMDTGVWEIKWEHRDNCITALNTLRRIPFLTITWAKDSVQPQTLHGVISHMRNPTSPRYPYPSSYAPRDAISPVARGRPFLLLDCGSGNDGEFRGSDVSSAGSTFARSPNVLPPHKLAPLRRENESRPHLPEDETEEGWTVIRPQNITRSILSSFPGSASASPAVAEETKRNARDWSEGDFPPLKTDRARPEDMKPLEIKDKEKPPSSAFISLNDPASPDPGNERTPVLRREESPDRKKENVPRPYLMHRRSLSNPVARLQVEVPHASESAEVPPTPELVDSSLTQSPTSAQPVLESPMYPTVVPLAEPCNKHEPRPSHEGHSQDNENTASESGQSAIVDMSVERHDHQRQTAVDLKTIFVGGLEPFAMRPWDETRLREIFDKYGQVQEVHVVTPPSKKAGFAFVTFLDEQSAARAIREEHNRSYDGRMIRVQIRDMDPLRGAFKFRGRGLGRRPFGFGRHHDGIGRQGNAIRTVEQNSVSLANAGRSFEHPYAYPRGPPGNPPFQVVPRGSHQLVPSASIGTDSSTLRSLNSFDSKTDVDASHEPDSKTAVSVTPPPSTLNVSTSMSSLSAPVTPQGLPSAPVAYYPPHTWVAPYGTQMHYPVPLGAYGGMMPPFPMPFAPTTQAAEPTAVTGSTPVQWNTMYRSAVPIAPYPYMIVPPANAEAPLSANSSQPATPVKGQPPLHPTGFIQGEHGMLIPVYQPEALKDYMSGSSPTQSLAASRAPAPNSVAGSSQHQPTFVNAPMWHGFAHAPQYFAYPVQPGPAGDLTSSTTSSTASAPQHTIHQAHGHPPHLSSSASGSSMISGVSNFAHVHPMHAQAALPASGTSAQGMPPPYLVGMPTNSTTAPPVIPRGGTQGSHAMHGVTPERLRMYSGRHPPRHDPAPRHGRVGQHGYGSDSSGPRSPSAVRSTSGFSSTPRGDRFQNNPTFHQRQRLGSAAPPLQLGLNRHNTDGEHSQHQHQRMTNFQQ